MFQWTVFKWYLASGRVDRALSVAAVNPEPQVRTLAAGALLTTLGNIMKHFSMPTSSLALF